MFGKENRKGRRKSKVKQHKGVLRNQQGKATNK
jgi:hypothetical protein